MRLSSMQMRSRPRWIFALLHILASIVVLFQLNPIQFESTKPEGKRRKYWAWLISSIVKASVLSVAGLPPSQFQCVAMSGWYGEFTWLTMTYSQVPHCATTCGTCRFSRLFESLPMMNFHLGPLPSSLIERNQSDKDCVLGVHAVAILTLWPQPSGLHRSNC